MTIRPPCPDPWPFPVRFQYPILHRPVYLRADRAGRVHEGTDPGELADRVAAFDALILAGADDERDDREPRADDRA